MNRDKFSFFTTPFKLITLIYSFVKKTKNQIYSVNKNKINAIKVLVIKCYFYICTRN